MSIKGEERLNIQGCLAVSAVLFLGMVNVVSKTTAQQPPVVPTTPIPAAGSTPSGTVATHVRQGDRAFASGEYEAAVAAYTQALTLYDLNEYAYYNRGLAYRKLKAYPKAIADFTKALQLNPQNTFAYLYRGMALQASNQPELAIADYTALLQINDQEPMAYVRRAEAYASLKQRDLARADFQKATDLYKKQGDQAQAEKIQSQVRSLK